MRLGVARQKLLEDLDPHVVAGRGLGRRRFDRARIRFGGGAGLVWAKQPDLIREGRGSVPVVEDEVGVWTEQAPQAVRDRSIVERDVDAACAYRARKKDGARLLGHLAEDRC